MGWSSLYVPLVCEGVHCGGEVWQQCEYGMSFRHAAGGGLRARASSLDMTGLGLTRVESCTVVALDLS
jgi:hypothetical protein